MGKTRVDQLGPGGVLLQDVDTKLTDPEKNDLLLQALPGATVEKYADARVVRFHDQVVLKKQVTHLGFPWEGFKKRIQIPKSWVDVELHARRDGLVARFVGIYHYGDVTIFVDFDPSTYVQRKANNSAAHVSTNDLYQALTRGEFSRVDGNGNRLTSVRSDLFARYLQAGYEQRDDHVSVIERFNSEFLNADQIYALDAIKQMHEVSWPDRFQGEWPGFYLEYRLDSFIRSKRLDHLLAFQKVKHRDGYDYDLVFMVDGEVEYFGDLKASNVLKVESPGNDAEDIARCIKDFGRFWYVVYEHATWHSRNNADLATIEWNEWKQSVGYKGSKPFNPLTYSSRFKESVRFVKMLVLEVNEANFGVVLGEFKQGKQPDGAARALKVMIKKRNIDNFLIYSESIAAE